MSTPLTRFLPATLLVLTLAGCGQPTDDKITARNQNEYSIWASQTLVHLSPPDAAVFQQAQQELKLDIMAHSSASGSDAINQAYLDKVNALTAHDVMVQGLQARLRRLQTEHDEAQKLYDANSKIRTADDASAAVVASRVTEDRQRADRAQTQITATQADLDRIKK
jgi:hypothetical protein